MSFNSKMISSTLGHNTSPKLNYFFCTSGVFTYMQLAIILLALIQQFCTETDKLKNSPIPEFHRKRYPKKKKKGKNIQQLMWKNSSSNHLLWLLQSELFQNFGNANFCLQTKITDQEEKLQNESSSHAVFLRKGGLRMAKKKHGHTCLALIRLI